MNWIFGDNINTDLITPGRYNLETDPEKLKQAAFVEFMPEFQRSAGAGDFIVAGQNFGCGSSRETAVIALKAIGIAAVLVKSIARIFFRNCLNNGLVAIELDTDMIRQDAVLRLDLVQGHLIDELNGISYDLDVPASFVRIYQAGGLTQFLHTNGINSLSTLF